MKRRMSEENWAFVLMITIIGLAIALSASLQGCMTVGYSGPDGKYLTPEQLAFEGALSAMALGYFVTPNIRDDDTLSDQQKAMAVVAIGDAYIKVSAPEFGTFLSLIEERAGMISKGKWTPSMQAVYILVVVLLDDGVPAPPDDTAFRHVIEEDLVSELEPLGLVRGEV